MYWNTSGLITWSMFNHMDNEASKRFIMHDLTLVWHVWYKSGQTSWSTLVMYYAYWLSNKLYHGDNINTETHDIAFTTATKLQLCPKKYMCVSDHMGLQNRVGRSGFFFGNIFVWSFE